MNIFTHSLLLVCLSGAVSHSKAIALSACGRVLTVAPAAAQSISRPIADYESTIHATARCQMSAFGSEFREGQSSVPEVRISTSERPATPLRVDHEESRISFAIRGGFSLPENDLRLTTGNFPSFSVGGYGQFLLRGSHQLRPVGEWLYFSTGRQDIQTSSQSQTIRTNVRAVLMGGEYLYRFKGLAQRLSVGGGFYLVRWSVHSVDELQLAAGGNAEASGNSHWNRPGEGPVVSYRISQHLELQGRWIHSNYGYEHIPINVVTLGAGWRF